MEEAFPASKFGANLSIDQSVETHTRSLKLLGLSESERSENALLRSRIDEQSQLIMILKKRADELMETAKASEKKTANLLSRKMELEEELALTMKRCSMLDARFNDLASNHQQMIEFKDEYKRHNAELVAENERLKSENARLFSGAIEERNALIDQLNIANDGLKSNLRLAEEQNRMMQKEFDKSKAEYQLEHDRLRKDKEAVERKLQQTEEQLQGMSDQLKQLKDNQSCISVEAESKIQKLTQERNDLSELSMSRGRAIQEKQAEISTLLRKLEGVQKSMKDMQAKHQKDADSVNADKEVQRLRKIVSVEQQKYQFLMQEFSEFKKHSLSLLEQEKQLNEKLRHLVS